MDEQQIKAIIEGVTKNVDSKLSEAFHVIDARLSEHSNINLAAHQEHTKAINGLRRNMITLWRHVRGPGSDPPDDGSEVTIPPVGLDAKASQTDLEVDALRGEMIAGFSKVEDRQKKFETKFDAKQDAQTEILKRVDKLTENPTVKKWGERIFVAVAMAVLSWLARGQVLPDPPQLPHAHAEGSHQ